MTPPSMIAGPPVEYTQRVAQAAIAHGVEGVVSLRCVVTLEGSVQQCKVVRGLPFVDAVVIEAIQRRRYRPAERGGRPVAVWYVFSVQLRLPR